MLFFLIPLILFIGFIAFIALKSKRDYNGFASTTRAKAWKGELKHSDIRELEQSIEQDALNKRIR